MTPYRRSNTNVRVGTLLIISYLTTENCLLIVSSSADRISTYLIRYSAKNEALCVEVLGYIISISWVFSMSKSHNTSAIF
jgi:hypothetical protein